MVSDQEPRSPTPSPLGRFCSSNRGLAKRSAIALSVLLLTNRNRRIILAARVNQLLQAIEAGVEPVLG